MKDTTEAVLGAVARLADASPRMQAADLFGAVYAFAMKAGCTPREVIDSAFKTVASDHQWRSLEPALREELGLKEING